MGKKPKLHVFVVEKLKGRWCLTHEGAVIHRGSSWCTKRSVVKRVSGTMDVFAEEIGQHGELRIRNLDGTFGPARTYPRSADPKRSKG